MDMEMVFVVLIESCWLILGVICLKYSSVLMGSPAELSCAFPEKHRDFGVLRCSSRTCQLRKFFGQPVRAPRHSRENDVFLTVDYSMYSDMPAAGM
jgi:hypothetical protein